MYLNSLERDRTRQNISGAGEQRRKEEDVRCPIYRAQWPLAPSATSTPIAAVQITVVDGRPSQVGGDSITSPRATASAVGGAGIKGNSPSHYVLSGQKMHLLERMKAVRKFVVLHKNKQ